MALRLFHITEFAQSLLSPATQRESRHPAVLLVLAALWVAVVGNLPVWRELWQLPMDFSAQLWISLCFLLLSTAVLTIGLFALNWPGVLRLVITLALWLTACNTVLLWSGLGYLRPLQLVAGWRPVLAQLTTMAPWKLALAFGLLALLPTVLVWRAPLRRIAPLYRLSQNLLLLVLAVVVAGLFWFMSRSALLPLLQDQPRWLELLSPFNSLLSLLR